LDLRNERNFSRSVGKPMAPSSLTSRLMKRTAAQ
jgi:hypothetical protein